MAFDVRWALGALLLALPMTGPLACHTGPAPDGGDGGGALEDAGIDCPHGPWTHESGAPVHLPDGGDLNPPGYLSDPSVLFEDGGFRIWFTSAPNTVLNTAYAESADGLLVTSLIDPVLEPSDGGWDQNGIETPSVLHNPLGGYRLYYTGDGPSFTFAIGLASSTNGLAWTKHGTAPVLRPVLGWEQACLDPPACTRVVGGTLEPTVLYDATSALYRMWYVGLGTLDSVTTYRVGFATSTDGVSWNRNPVPVFEPGAPGQWDEDLVSQINVIAEPSGAYDLFYFGSSHAQSQACSCDGCCALQAGAIGHATSSDGIHWTRDPQNPILTPSSGSWDSWTVGGPSALIHDGELLVWYFGTASPTSFSAHLGLISATCGP